MIKLPDIHKIKDDPSYPNNKSLRNKSGKEDYLISVYSVKEPRQFLNHEKVTGSILYPFAVRKLDEGYIIDHIPTGCYIASYRLRKDCTSKIKTLLRETTKTAYTGTKFTEKNYKKLQEIFI